MGRIVFAKNLEKSVKKYLILLKKCDIMIEVEASRVFTTSVKR